MSLISTLLCIAIFTGIELNYEEALRDHRLVTLQQRRNELCSEL